MERAYQMSPRKMTRSSECVFKKICMYSSSYIWGTCPHPAHPTQGSIEHLLYARQDSGCWGWNSQRDTVVGPAPGELTLWEKQQQAKIPKELQTHQSVESPQGQTQHWKREMQTQTPSEAATIPPMGRTVSLAG